MGGVASGWLRGRGRDNGSFSGDDFGGMFGSDVAVARCAPMLDSTDWRPCVDCVGESTAAQWLLIGIG